jgi:alkanesulfonate monooxygenase SsuD/methylene tetrahydromethanopterin reductase-like flavin-dependent oxidoreductase (luciferase family)
MKFGYFANQNNRRLEKSFRQVVEETRDLARYLDGQDWESIWFTEHHFGHEGYEVCPNPLMMSCDVAAHTDRIRIGQAANIITFWNPIRVAEDIAMLDHMNNGRTEVAVGRGIYGRDRGCCRARHIRARGAAAQQGRRRRQSGPELQDIRGNPGGYPARLVTGILRLPG